MYMQPSASMVCNIFHTVLQVERARQRVPEIIGIAVAFIAVLAILLSIVYCVKKRSYNVKSQRNSLDVRQSNNIAVPL